MTDKKTLISFIIPAKNEEESIPQLYKEIVAVVEKIGNPFEIIFIDDGSKDDTFNVVSKLHEKDKRVKVIRFRNNFGKSAALQIGFEHANGDIIFTLDADLQDNPKEIPNFLEKLSGDYDLVSGWKKTRNDPITKVIPSRILNYLTRKLTKVNLHDVNCGFKAYKREVVENLNLYGELYRFIPVFAANLGFKVTEIPIDHRPRVHGKSKFGGGRFIKGLLDLLTIVFLTGYTRRPGHFFGTLGIISFIFGFAIGTYIAYLRFAMGNIQNRHPLLFLGMLLMIVGVQLVSAGLVAEMIVSSRQKETYKFAVKDTLGLINKTKFG